MSDFSFVFRNAISKEFPKAIQTKCFFHLKENVRKKFRSSFPDLEVYLDTLSHCITLNEVQKLWKIVKGEILKNLKENDIGKEFVKSFEENYLSKENCQWFIGASRPGFCNTNNQLEGHHRYLKKEVFEQNIREMRNCFYFFFT